MLPYLTLYLLYFDSETISDNSAFSRVYIYLRGFITSAEEGGYVFGSVCLSVCLSVRRITRKLVN